MQSDVGSEYEEFGDTCGNRNEPAGLCVNEQGDGGGPDEGITDLGDVEFDGDMESMLADIYEDSLGLEREKAECLSARLDDAMSKTGRASCREGVGESVLISVVGVTLKKKKKNY